MEKQCGPMILPKINMLQEYRVSMKFVRTMQPIPIVEVVYEKFTMFVHRNNILPFKTIYCWLFCLKK